MLSPSSSPSTWSDEWTEDLALRDCELLNILPFVKAQAVLHFSATIILDTGSPYRMDPGLVNLSASHSDHLMDLNLRLTAATETPAMSPPLGKGHRSRLLGAAHIKPPPETKYHPNSPQDNQHRPVTF